jgi:site-specific DNA-cytosine methylase
VSDLDFLEQMRETKLAPEVVDPAADANSNIQSARIANRPPEQEGKFWDLHKKTGIDVNTIRSMTDGDRRLLMSQPKNLEVFRRNSDIANWFAGNINRAMISYDDVERIEKAHNAVQFLNMVQAAHPDEFTFKERLKATGVAALHGPGRAAGNVGAQAWSFLAWDAERQARLTSRGEDFMSEIEKSFRESQYGPKFEETLGYERWIQERQERARELQRFANEALMKAQMGRELGIRIMRKSGESWEESVQRFERYERAAFPLLRYGPIDIGFDDITGLPVTLAPSFVAGIGGTPLIIATAGAQSFGGTFGDKRREMSFDEAEQKALLAGAITAFMTAAVPGGEKGFARLIRGQSVSAAKAVIVGSVLRSNFTNIMKQSFLEGFEEWGDEVLQGVMVEGLTWKESMLRAINAGLLGMTAGGGIELASIVSTHRTGDIADSLSDEEKFQAAIAVADATDTITRSPEMFAELMQKSIKLRRSAYLDPVIAEQLLDDNPDKTEVLDSVGISEDSIRLAAEAKGSIRVDLPQTIAMKSDPEIRQVLLQNMKMRPNAMSKAEADSFNSKEELDRARAEVSEAQARNREFNKEFRSLRKDLEVAEGVTKDIAEMQMQQLGAVSWVMWYRNKDHIDSPSNLLRRVYIRRGEFGEDPAPVIEEILGEERARREEASIFTQGMEFDPAGDIVTESEAFKKWFGDSKVVDKQTKEPMVVYHGTPGAETQFDVFDPFEGRRSFGGPNRIGTWFSSRRDYAEAYAETFQEAPGPVFDVYISMKNPAVFFGNEGFETVMNTIAKEAGVRFPGEVRTAEQIEQAREFFKTQLGKDRDGIIIRDFTGDESIVGDGGPQDIFIAFDPEQIKSTSNRGTFDPIDPNILHQAGPPIKRGSKKYELWYDQLTDRARGTLDHLGNILDTGEKVNMRVVRNGVPVEWNVMTGFIQVAEWNQNVMRRKEVRKTARELYKQLSPRQRKDMNFNEDGTFTETDFDREFKVMTSFMQRVIDTMADEEAPDFMILPDGTTLDLDGQDGRLLANGGEAYRRSILQERREQFIAGTLKQTSLAAVSSRGSDSWGAMGFLASNSKTFGSGDFTTICPQMYYNKGCWYCYRRAGLESGVNVKLAAQRIWYTGEILRISDADIEALNRNGGLRLQSFGDWMGQRDHAQFADVLLDAEARGLQVKIITKEVAMIEYVAHLKEQGVANNVFMNLSTDEMVEAAGEIGESEQWDSLNPDRPFARTPEGLPVWKRALSVDEAAAINEKYDWVNIRTVVGARGSLEQMVDDYIEALRDPRIRVITGYHGNIRQPDGYLARAKMYEGPKGQSRIKEDTIDSVVEVLPLGDSGMPGFDEEGRLTGLDSRGNRLDKYRQVLHDRIQQEGLESEYAEKSCCVQGKCEGCRVNCGAPEASKQQLNGTIRFPVRDQYLDSTPTPVTDRNGREPTIPLVAGERELGNTFESREAFYQKGYKEDALSGVPTDNETVIAPEDVRVPIDMVSLFSGAGTVELGLAGLVAPGGAVEINSAIADVYRIAHGEKIEVKDVRQVDFSQYLDAEYLTASPVCKNYSKGKLEAEETPLDIATAQSTANAIRIIRPAVFTLENVKGFRTGEALQIIRTELDNQGYTYDEDVYNAADYGAYTFRERYLLRAVREGQLPPKPLPTHGPGRLNDYDNWYDPIQDKIDSLEDDQLAPWQWERLKMMGVATKLSDFKVPTLVMGGSATATNVPIATWTEPAPTIKATHKEPHRIVMPDGRVKRLDPRSLARIQGMPDTFPLPDDVKLARTVIGNGIPTQLTRAVFGPLMNRVPGANPAYPFVQTEITGVVPGGKVQVLHQQAAQESEDLVQRISSADTSRNQVAAAFKSKAFKAAAGDLNIDIGGGKYDLGTEFLANELGVRNIVYDPFNRTEEQNRSAVDFLRRGNLGDTVTANNVLNVIAEPDVRRNVILQVAKALKPDGTAFFQVHEGKKDGVAKQTRDGWQNNRKAADYMTEVSEHFKDVTRSGNLIIAKNPTDISRKAVWELGDGYQEFLQSADDFQQIELIDTSEALNFDENTTPQEIAEHNARVEIKEILREAGNLRGAVVEAMSDAFTATGQTKQFAIAEVEEALEASGEKRSIEEIVRDIFDDELTVDDLTEYEGTTDLFASAKESMGTTGNPFEAGYILPDGDYLDLSGTRQGGPGGTRNLDHRQLDLPIKSGLSGTDLMVAFQRAGAIRMDRNARSFDIETMPTSEQLTVLRDLIADIQADGEVVNIDLYDGDRKEFIGIDEFEVEASGMTPRNIISRIRRFYTERELLQRPEAGGTPRGSLWIVGDEYILSLLEHDMSTFAHEVGHIYMAELERLVRIGLVSDELRDDWELLNGWFLERFGKRWEDMGTLERETAHETFADALLDYYTKAESPSAKLEKAFENQRRWLMRLYNNGKKMNVEVNPEMKGLFDRMLATQREIDQAVAFREMMPWTSEEMSKHPGTGEVRRGQHNEQIEDFRSRVGQRAFADRQRAIARNEAEWKQEIKDEMSLEPPYKAYEQIREAGIGIDREQALTLWGKQVVADMKKVSPRLIAQEIEQGLDPNVLAVKSGFADADSMRQTLLSVLPPKAEAQRRLDLRSMESDLDHDPREAILDGDELERLVQMRRNMYARAKKGTITRLEKQAFVNTAQRLIGRMPTRKAMDVSTFMNEMEKHIALERKANAEDDMDGVFEHSYGILLNVELAREGRKIRDTVEKLQKQAKKTVRQAPGTMSYEHQYVYTDRAALYGLVPTIPVLEPPLNPNLRTLRGLLAQENVNAEGDVDVNPFATPLVNDGMWSEDILDGEKSDRTSRLIALPTRAGRSSRGNCSRLTSSSRSIT